MSGSEVDELRRAWVRRVMGTPGLEILAVQTLRNSIMAATVMASTSAISLVGVLGLGHLRTGDLAEIASHPDSLLVLLPLLLLASCVALFSQAVRLYHRCSYRVSLLGDEAQELATVELLRASRLYRTGWGVFYLAMAAGAAMLLRI